MSTRMLTPRSWRLLVTVLLLSATTPLHAQVGADPAHGADAANSAISQLRSPYCPGLMLEVCPSWQAELLRDSIRDLAAAGHTSDEIVEWTLARHGEEWRAVPKRNGWGLWAWLAPPLVLLGGLALVWGKLRSLRRSRGSDREPAAPELSTEDKEELAAALRDWHGAGNDS